MNWNLINCALSKHTYAEPTKDEILGRLIKICVYCGNTVILSDDYKFKKLEASKSDIILAINEDKFFHAKEQLDNLLKEWGY